MGTLQCCRKTESFAFETEDNAYNKELESVQKKKRQLHYILGKNLSLDINIYLRITLDSITLYYDNCDDYGLIFQPFISVSIDNNQSISETFDSNPHEKLNISTLSNSHIDDSNNRHQLIGLNSMIDNSYIASSSKKTFTFEQTKRFTLEKNKFYSSIVFTLKNSNWTQTNNDIHKHSTYYHSIIAKAKMTLIDLTVNQQRFNGEMYLKQRDIKIIGILKVHMTIDSNKPIDSTKIEEGDNITEDSFFKENEVKTENCFMNSPQHFFMYQKEQFPYNEGDHTEDILNVINKVNNPILDYEFLMKQFKTLKSINQSSLLLLNGYEMILYLYRISLIDKNFKEIDNFLNQIDLTLMMNYIGLMYNNPYVIKVYLMFLIYYFKGTKSCDYTVEPSIQEKIVIQQIIDIFTQVKEKQQDTQIQLLNEEIIILILNLIIELLYVPRKVQLFSYDAQIKAKEKLFEFSKGLYAAISNILWCIFDIYFHDSEIVYLIIRIMRKIIQNHDEPKAKEYRKINGMSENDYKINIINDNNGFVLERIMKVIKVYYHYPSLISNIFQILVILTKDINTDSLIFIMEKLPLPEIPKHLIYYLGKLRCISRNINDLYLKFLANLSELAKSNQYQDVFTLVEDDIRIENSKSYNKEYENEVSIIAIEFIFYLLIAKKEKLLYENVAKYVTLHQLISIISLNITLYPSIAYDLLDRDKKSFSLKDKNEFYYDSFKYIKNIREISKMPNKDFMTDAITFAKKGVKLEDIERIILSTIENNLKMIYNVLIIDITAQGVYDILDGENTDMYKISDHFEIVSQENQDLIPIDNILGEIINYFKSKKIDAKELERIKVYFDKLFNDPEDDELE